MMSWKALLAAIGTALVILFLVVVLSPPKFDALIKYNSPSVYVLTLALVFLFMIVIFWKELRK
jgi:predicted neutral ceramidase superfamily lipid hydrolase